MSEQTDRIKNSIKLVIHGKDEVIDMVLCAILAKGHILLEDIPGVGKTTLVTALAKVMSLDYKRIQFTPDVLPSDLSGFTMYDKNTGEFSFREGAVFTNLFLADEINRTSPKTQSALLEVMEEQNVTVDGVTRNLPTPFFVIATQNPVGASGTQKLPESQLDRFMIRLTMGYPDHNSAIDILRGDSHEIVANLNPCVSRDELLQMQRQAEAVETSEAILSYIVQLTEVTRDNDLYSLGLSPRASIAMLKMARARAFTLDRDYVVPEDVKAVYFAIANHRVILSTKAKATGYTLEMALAKSFDSVKMPG
ncbi:MAG: MoxR family ATPase [Lachnospiraceae bacterium]|nr:MoxR family ATPase [Lachnospiraceae bacterium]MBR3483375.1 MoxR family ATPase [Lachnospiraceae bacterium]MBR4542342.1 MoxR family ATPase [Lachnospiraceae bacterium]